MGKIHITTTGNPLEAKVTDADTGAEIRGITRIEATITSKGAEAVLHLEWSPRMDCILEAQAITGPFIQALKKVAEAASESLSRKPEEAGFAGARAKLELALIDLEAFKKERGA